MEMWKSSSFSSKLVICLIFTNDYADNKVEQIINKLVEVLNENLINRIIISITKEIDLVDASFQRKFLSKLYFKQCFHDRLSFDLTSPLT